MIGLLVLFESLSISFSATIADKSAYDQVVVKLKIKHIDSKTNLFKFLEVSV